MARARLAVAAMVAAGVLGGCGGNDSLTTDDFEGGGVDDYCTAVEDARAQFEDLATSEATGASIEDLRETLADLESKAPDSVADDYATLIGGFDQLDEALAEVGLSIGDFDDPAKLQEIITNADPEQVQAITDAASAIDAAEFQQAGEAIEDHAKTDCGITLQ